ncbi:phosphatase PAP2 family protein [Nocardioides daeguensis]|uniref:Inositolphosphotransferase Aur1/Ipt1 domain-containing protein n=1 Tax=Nocardioides daeguensis TaxID=908359 RepID=A0ABP6WK50_9ACTN|nr:phosphatase PAP2 family protein [Nocardioides daeguensis]MBV6729576.1 phosphatase PAP2 family protein [Nocardioides daeguensis]MCR1775008.1 phosphatase PAP2 family protein [Nocardioides daeguensis]
MYTHHSTGRGAPSFALAWLAGLGLAVLTVVFSAVEDIPIKDPDSLIPGYIRFPAIVLGAIALDVVPRTFLGAGRPRAGWLRRLRTTFRTVLRERWPLSHWKFALNGVIAWYLCYAAFRNVKSMAPFVHENLYDDPLADLDRFLFAGHDPAAVLHAWFGTGLAAHFFSAVYIVWIALVPVSIAIALVWTRQTRAGEWFVTAVAVDWALGALLYVLVPTVGPIYSDSSTFAALPETYVSRLADSMWDDRVNTLATHGESGLQTIAAFASLHVGIMMTICLIVEAVRLARWVRISAWTFFGLTVLATVYLGWHFFVDVIAGAALGAFAVWIAGIATGNRVGLRARLVTEVSAPDEPASASHPEALASRSVPRPDHPAAD